MNVGDDHWLGEFRSGNLDGFAALIGRYQTDVFAVALAFVLDRALAEDVAQEAFIRAYTHRDQLRDPSAIRSWLCTITRNVARTMLRTRRRERLVATDDIELERADDGELQSDQLAARTLRVHVRQALDRVPAKYREVLTLYYLHEQSIAAVAEMLGLTQSAALQRLSRGRKLVEQHGAELRELVEERPRRSFALSVLALLAMRQHAQAAPPSKHSAAMRPAGMHWIVGVGVVLALVANDGPSRADVRAPATSEVTPVAAANDATHVVSADVTTVVATSDIATRDAAADVTTVVATTDMATSDVATTDITTRDAAADVSADVTRDAATIDAAADVSADITRDVATRDAAADVTTHDGATTAAARNAAASAPLRATIAVAGKVDATVKRVDCGACPAPATVPPMRPRADRMDLTNGWLETAAMPRAGDIAYETLAMGMQVRAGLHRNVAIHVGAMGIDIVEGTYENAGLAFGGGAKLGATLGPTTRIAVVGEIAREVNAKTLDAGAPWLGRAYAALTLGNARTHVTLSGGVTAVDNGDPRWVSPTFGVGTYLGWDDRLGFVLESQYFTRAKAATTTGTSVMAVRFRNNELERNAVRVERFRIDVGVLLLHEDSEDIDGLPWLQVALGW